MNFAAVLPRAATLWGERPAVSVGSRPVLTNRELARRARFLAAALRRAGLAPGDRVGIAMANRPAYFEVLYGIWHAGLCAVPINARLHRREFAYILENSGARICFTDAGLEPTLAPLAAEVETLERVISVESRDHATFIGENDIDLIAAAPTDPAWLFYTSGTTGRPKGAMLTHRNLWMVTLSYYADVDPLRSTHTMLHPAPLSHGSGLFSLALTAVGGNHVIPESGQFEPVEIFQMIEAWPCVSMFAAPTMLVRMRNSPALGTARLDSLETVTYGGSPMYVADLRRALDALGPKLLQIYGQGESPCTITSLAKEVHAASEHPRWLERLASAGVARSGVEVRVADAEDRTLPPGELGEVLVRGDVVMAGYWRNEGATAESLRGGWLHTGDLGVLDEDGFLTLKDRSKDMIISGGANIYPREIEEVLLQHPDVLEASVVGRAHPEWVEEVVAFVVARPGVALSGEALDRHCIDNMARYKRPRLYRFLDALPKNNYGKVLKTELRQRIAQEEKA